MAFGRMGARGGFGSFGVLGRAGTTSFDMDMVFDDISSYASYSLQDDSIYIASIDTTVWFEQTYLSAVSGTRAIWAKGYNHTTGAIVGPYNVGVNGLANDSHGLPIPGYDQNTGRIYVAYGSHATPLLLAMSTNVNDITSWTGLTSIAGQHTYPKYIVPTAGSAAGVHHVFTRNNAGTSFQLQITKSAAVAAGVPTWGASTVIIDLGPDARVDSGNYLLAADGKSIHGVFTRPNNADTTRKDVFYIIYNTDTGAIVNFSGDTTTTTFPIALGSMQLHWRIVDQTTGGTNEGNVPAFNFDLAGNSHVLYMDGASGGPYSLKHIMGAAGGGSAWTSPVTVGAFPTLPTSATHRFDGMAVVALPDGSVDLYWVTQSTTQYARGGDISNVNRTSGGVFGAQTLVRAATSSFALDGPSPTLNAQAQSSTSGVKTSARVHFGEINGDETVETGILKGYAYGDGNVPIKTNYSSLSRTLFSTLQPLTAQKAAIDEFITTMETLGFWSARMELFHLALNDFTSASVNWANPGQFTLTQVGAPTFTALTSFKGDGAATKYSTGFIPSTDATKSSTNDTSIGVWIRGTDVSNDSFFDYGSSGGGNNTIIDTHQATNGAYRATITATSNQNFGTGATSPGFHHLVRSASNVLAYYKFGSLIASAATPVSAGQPTGAVAICGTTTGFSTREVSLGFYAKSFSAAEALTFYNYIQKLRNALQML